MHTPLLWWLRTAPVTQGGTHRRDPRGLGGCLGADDRGERPCSHTRAGRHPGHGRPQLTSLSDRVPSAPAVPAPFAHQTRLPGAFARVLLAPGRLPKDSCTTICTLLMGTCSRRSPTHGLPGLLLTLRCQPRPSGHPALLLTLRCQPHLSGHPGFMLTLGCQRRPGPLPPSLASVPLVLVTSAVPLLPRSLSKHRTNALDLRTGVSFHERCPWKAGSFLPLPRGH